MRRGKDESNVEGFQEDLLGNNGKEQPRKNGMQNDTLGKVTFMKIYATYL